MFWLHFIYRQWYQVAKLLQSNKTCICIIFKRQISTMCMVLLIAQALFNLMQHVVAHYHHICCAVCGVVNLR